MNTRRKQRVQRKAESKQTREDEGTWFAVCPKKRRRWERCFATHRRNVQHLTAQQKGKRFSSLRVLVKWGSSDDLLRRYYRNWERRQSR